jgi:hypothetical protein
LKTGKKSKSVIKKTALIIRNYGSKDLQCKTESS